MLERLQVRGLGIIDAVEVELAPGFVALTGETGAGKSLLVSSLELLAGRRASSELVRTGDKRLTVEGSFRVEPESDLAAILENVGAANEDGLSIRRELTSEGRGRCWINDVSVRASTLQQIAPFLLSIHGQHEQHGLADAEVQRRLVDDFGGHEELLGRVTACFEEWRQAADHQASLESARANRRDRLDTISFQLAEINAVAPMEGEHEQLTTRRQVLRNAARLRELSESILRGLDDDEASVVDRIARAEREVDEMVGHGLPLAEGNAALIEARIHVEELVREVRVLSVEMDGDPGELDDAESRLHSLDTLMLKYGEPLGKVLEHRETLMAEKARLEEVEDELETAAGAATSALGAFAEVARRLDRARHQAGVKLARAVEAVLARLNMVGTRLEFRWQAREDDRSPLLRDGEGVAFSSVGVEECELLIAANPGEEPRPMARIASGGELSRIHLAIRTVLRSARPGGPVTLLFDEVDSGLGGATAAALAGLLADLAETDQVLVVTHLPQVAAAAGTHFKIDKVERDKRAVTRILELQDEDREIELARMLAGNEIGASARAHARALLGNS